MFFYGGLNWLGFLERPNIFCLKVPELEDSKRPEFLDGNCQNFEHKSPENSGERKVILAEVFGEEAFQ
jgi:hypothetical protein